MAWRAGSRRLSGRMAEPSVLICIPTLASGGAERQVRLLAPRLVDRGIRLALFSRLGQADMMALEKQGVRCFPVKAAGNHDPRQFLELRSAARAVEADIVQSFLPQMDIVGGAVALSSGRIWLLSERSSLLAYGDGWKNRLRARLGRRAAAVVANSPSGLDVWPDHKNRQVIANGLDHAAIAAAAPLSAEEESGLAGRTIIVSVARLSPEKGLDLLLAAAARLKADIPGLLVVLMGEGPELAPLQALAARLGVGEHIRFMGFRDDVWSWLRRADLFVSPSAFEGHPNAVLEAAAAGLPLVLSDIFMHRDAVGDAGARFVPVGDEAALAAAILALVRDPDAARAVARSARGHVEALSIDRAAARFADLYRRLAASAS